MSTISSKQAKKQGLVDPVYVLGFLVVFLALLLYGPITDTAYSSISSSLGTLGVAAPAGEVASSVITFGSDQQYWDANCSHGWSSDSTCEDIVQRVQTCSLSNTSGYCSEYDLYLQPFRDQ